MRASNPERIDIDTGAIRLSALDYGNASAPPLLIHHGMADHAGSMDVVARALADRFHVISFDMRGHGDSDQPGAYSVLHFMADLRGVVEALEVERPVLVGHSLGAQVMVQFCGLYPEIPQLMLSIEGMGPPARIGLDTAEGRRLYSRGHVELVGAPVRRKPLADLDEAVERFLTTHTELDPERAREIVAGGTRPAMGGAGLEWKFDPRTRDWITAFEKDTIEERWSSVQCPVLLVTGEDSWDRWWSRRITGEGPGGVLGPMDPDEVQRRVDLFPDAIHRSIPNAGHMIQFDQPDALNAVIAAFLDERYPSNR